VKHIAPTARLRGAFRRTLAAGAALLAVPAVVLASPGVATAATTQDPAAAGAGWAGRQLNAQHLITVRLPGGGSFADYGLTADIVLALDSAGVGRTAARQATRALRQHVLDYTGGGDPSEFFAGSFAKLLNVAAAQGIRGNRFGSGPRHALAFRLRRLECGTANTGCAAGDRGRFSDVSQFGDFSNAITQSLALTGLERATKAGPSAASVRFLRQQQCANGSFPLDFHKARCVASVDATAFAVQALLATGAGPAKADARRAVGWLVRHQHGNGSFTGNGARNTNTTGLAGQALRAAGRDREADAAAAFITSLQVGCSGKASRRGMVHYDRADSGEALRATPQAVPALAGVGLADVTAAGAARALPRLAC
jgi:hypothetical protein